MIGGDLRRISKDAMQLKGLIQHTVKPLERVVDWVVEGSATGEAKPRFTGWMDLRAARLLRAWFKLKAKRREAIAEVVEWVEEGEVEGGWRKELVVALRLEVRKVRLFTQLNLANHSSHNSSNSRQLPFTQSSLHNYT